MTERVRLLLAHGVDPDGLGYHPIYAARTAYELATLAGNVEIAELLAAAGAKVADIDPVDQLLSRCLAGDAVGTRAMVQASPELLPAAIRRAPATVARAVQTGRLGAVQLALELGFAVNARMSGEHRQTALHTAAEGGHVAIAELLVAAGADVGARDTSFDGTPLDWAEHLGQADVAHVLRARVPPAP